MHRHLSLVEDSEDSVLVSAVLSGYELYALMNQVGGRSCKEHHERTILREILHALENNDMSSYPHSVPDEIKRVMEYADQMHVFDSGCTLTMVVIHTPTGGVWIINLGRNNVMYISDEIYTFPKHDMGNPKEAQRMMEISQPVYPFKETRLLGFTRYKSYGGLSPIPDVYSTNKPGTIVVTTPDVYTPDELANYVLSGGSLSSLRGITGFAVRIE